MRRERFSGFVASANVYVTGLRGDLLELDRGQLQRLQPRSEDSVKGWPNEREERGRLVVALQKAITSSFDEGDWKELGHDTGTVDWITGHGRLLRSLSAGDSDYGGHVFDAIEMLRKSNESSLEILPRRGKHSPVFAKGQCRGVLGLCG